MLSEAVSEGPIAQAIEAWDATALTGGSLEHGALILWTDTAHSVALCRFLRDEQHFERVAGISAIDRYPAEPRFELVYLLHSVSRNLRLRLKIALPGQEPAAPSLTGVWPGANWYERETFDLFGIHFDGHPNLKRIMMPEDWQGHPLRRDYPVHGYKYSYQDE